MSWADTNILPVGFMVMGICGPLLAKSEMLSICPSGMVIGILGSVSSSVSSRLVMSAVSVLNFWVSGCMSTIFPLWSTVVCMRFCFSFRVMAATVLLMVVTAMRLVLASAMAKMAGLSPFSIHIIVWHRSMQAVMIMAMVLCLRDMARQYFMWFLRSFSFILFFLCKLCAGVCFFLLCTRLLWYNEISFILGGYYVEFNKI